MEMSYTAHDANTIGKNIRRLREDKGITQKELAKRMSLKQATVSSWETGRTEPSSAAINLLCIILFCSRDDIMGNIVIDVETLKNIENMKDRLYRLFESDSDFRHFLSNSKWADELNLTKGDKT